MSCADTIVASSRAVSLHALHVFLELLEVLRRTASLCLEIADLWTACGCFAVQDFEENLVVYSVPVLLSFRSVSSSVLVPSSRTRSP